MLRPESTIGSTAIATIRSPIHIHVTSTDPRPAAGSCSNAFLLAYQTYSTAHPIATPATIMAVPNSRYALARVNW